MIHTFCVTQTQSYIDEDLLFSSIMYSSIELVIKLIGTETLTRKHLEKENTPTFQSAGLLAFK